MVRDEKKLELATHYRKRGYSYSEISKICGISKSTVSAWLAKKTFSKSVKQDNQIRAGKNNARRLGLLNKAKNKERHKRYTEAIKTAQTEYRHYRFKPLFIAGLALYLAQGDRKTKSVIRLSTSNIDSHRLFRKFCHTFLGATKSDIKFWLLANEESALPDLVKRWSVALRLTKDQCYKHQSLNNPKGQGTLHSGTGNTIIGNTVLKLKLDRWIELMVKGL